MVEIKEGMTRGQIESAKWLSLTEIKIGDKLKLTDGSICEFVRLKDKKFIGIMDGKSYNIPVMMFDKLVEKVVQKSESKEYLTLKKGDLFYIRDNKSNALLFIFEEMRNSRIIGINPITKGNSKIDVNLYVGKVSDIK